MYKLGNLNRKSRPLISTLLEQKSRFCGSSDFLLVAHFSNAFFRCTQIKYECKISKLELSRYRWPKVTNTTSSHYLVVTLCYVFISYMK